MSTTGLIISRFYHFVQNNSGGWHDLDENKGITCHVIIEAYSFDEANRRAQNIGIYFDGVNRGIDCSCCGDRWTELCSESSATTPQVNGTEVFRYSGFCWMPPGKEIAVHYLNGSIAWYGFNKKTRRK